MCLHGCLTPCFDSSELFLSYSYDLSNSVFKDVKTCFERASRRTHHAWTMVARRSCDRCNKWSLEVEIEPCAVSGSFTACCELFSQKLWLLVKRKWAEVASPTQTFEFLSRPVLHGVGKRLSLSCNLSVLRICKSKISILFFYYKYAWKTDVNWMCSWKWHVFSFTENSVEFLRVKLFSIVDLKYRVQR